MPRELFSKLLQTGAKDPARLTRLLGQLFQAMSKGGEFGVDAIAHFNGGLFADAEVIPLLPPEIAQLVRAAERDWSNVEPSIFGTLFERTLDPAKRSQIGAHYTSKQDILNLLERRDSSSRHGSAGHSCVLPMPPHTRTRQRCASLRPCLSRPGNGRT